MDEREKDYLKTINRQKQDLGDATRIIGLLIDKLGGRVSISTAELVVWDKEIYQAESEFLLDELVLTTREKYNNG